MRVNRPGCKSQTVITCLALGFATLTLYWPVHTHEFVNYDDWDYVSKNPHLRAGISKHAIHWAFTSISGANTYWHPLTWVSHMVDCQLFGVQPGPHHLVSAFFHTVNVLLLFLVMSRMTGAFWRSVLVAALFAWHPLQVDTVAWIAERKNLLSVFFVLLCLAAYQRYARRPGLWRYLPVFFLLCLALMSKALVVTLPCLLLVLDFWPLRRLSCSNLRFKTLSPQLGGRQPHVQYPESSILFLVLEKLPLFLPVALSCYLMILKHQLLGEISGGEALPLGARVCHARVSEMRYCGKTIWPTHLAVYYPHPGWWPTWHVGLAIAFLATVSLLVLWLARSRPYLLAGWLWFLGSLVPAIGIVQAGLQSMADRFAYLPVVGLFIMLAWGLPDLLARRPQRKLLLPTLAGASLLTALLLTTCQLRHWKNTDTLFKHDLAVAGDNFIARNILAEGCFARGHYEDALAHLRRAVDLQPANYTGYSGIALVLNAQGKFAEAIPYSEKAVAIEPAYPDAHANLGVSYQKLGRLAEAEEQLREAVRLAPDCAQSAEFCGRLAIVLLQQGRLYQALPLFEQSLRADPNNLEVRAQYISALMKKGFLDQAVAQGQVALRFAPDSPDALNNYGAVLFAQGKVEQALVCFQKALQLKPGFPEAHNNCGITMAARGGFAQALPHFKEALRVKPDFLDARSRLIQALLREKRIAEAVEEYHHLLRQQPESAEIMNNLAWILATCPDAAIRNGTEALQLAQRACVANPHSFSFLDTLGAAYAEAGHFAEASSTVQKAITLAQTAGQTNAAAKFRLRLDLYQSNQSYRGP